tara:strand:+ start:934 stop:1716 length:783 start_codon:yes stop_codon:yes gene_type:complete
MADIKFYANILAASDADKLINHSAGSGLGFYGTDHAVSVAIGSQQDTTFVTNENGSSKGAAVPNTKYSNTDDNRLQTPGKVVADTHGASAIDLNALPNNAAPLNIRFTHDSTVKCQNAKLRIFDRNNINNHASGVITYAYEVRHPAVEFTNAGALRHRSLTFGDDKWFIFEKLTTGAVRNMDSDTTNSVVEDMPMTNSPGRSGLNTDDNDLIVLNGVDGASTEGAAHRSLQHDWYLALSSEPKEIGSKQDYGLYFSVEYL